MKKNKTIKISTDNPRAFTSIKQIAREK